MKVMLNLFSGIVGIIVIGVVVLIFGIGVGYVPKLFVAEKDTEISGLPPYLATAIGEKSYGMPIETFALPKGELIRPNVGEVAPDFSLPSTQGGEISLADYRGKMVVLDFTTTWCGMTYAEHDNFTAIQSKYGDEVVFLTVDSYSFDEMEDLVNYQRKYQKEWLFALDKSLDVAKAYGVRQTVSTFVIDQGGVIRYIDNWITDFDELDSALSQII